MRNATQASIAWRGDHIATCPNQQVPDGVEHTIILPGFTMCVDTDDERLVIKCRGCGESVEIGFDE